MFIHCLYCGLHDDCIPADTAAEPQLQICDWHPEVGYPCLQEHLTAEQQRTTQLQQQVHEQQDRHQQELRQAAEQAEAAQKAMLQLERDCEERCAAAETAAGNLEAQADELEQQLEDARDALKVDMQPRSQTLVAKLHVAWVSVWAQLLEEGLHACRQQAAAALVVHETLDSTTSRFYRCQLLRR